MLAISARAPRRPHPSLVQVARTQAKIRFVALLQGNQILGESGQTLTAPDEIESAPLDTGTRPAQESMTDVPLSLQIEVIDRAHFLALNIDADRSERENLRSQIAVWEIEQHDAQQCGFGGDWSSAIAAAATRIEALNERLEGADIAAEVCA